MKFLVISLGKLEEKRKDCINKSLGMMKAGDSLTVFCSPDGADWPDGTLFVDEKAALDAAFGECGNPDFWRIYCGRRWPQFKSDFLRLWMATKYPDLLYLDTDVRLFGLPEFKEGKPYFAQAGHSMDFFLFYVNGQCGWFRDFMARLERGTNPKTLFIPFILCGKGIREETEMIPEEFFRHERGRWE